MTHLSPSQSIKISEHNGIVVTVERSGKGDSQKHRDESARKAIDEYYKDRNASGQSPLTAHR